MSYRSGWKLFTYQFAGSSRLFRVGHHFGAPVLRTGNEGLCLSMGARDSMGMGCHEVSCRPES